MFSSGRSVVLGLLIACLESQAQSGPAPAIRLLGKLPGAPDGPCLFKFSSSQEGWAWDRGRLLWATADGGLSWRPAALPAAMKPTDYVSSLFPISAKSVRAVVYSVSTVFETRDGGAKWTTAKAAQPNSGLIAVELDGARGWAVIGSDFDSPRGFLRQEIYLTTDGARSWQRTWGGATNWDGMHWALIQGFQFADEDNGVAIGASAVLKTSDGGRTWVEVPYHFDEAIEHEPNRIQQVYFIDAQKGWLLKAKGSMFRTEDGGRTWVRILNGAGSATTEGGALAHQLWFESAMRGWLIGSNMKLFETEDGGNHWVRVEGPKKGAEFVFLSCSRDLGCRFSDTDRNLYGVAPSAEK